MSYSQLIQKDNPAGFWSLDETSSTTAYTHGFIVDASKSKLYNGTYSSAVNGSDFNSILPIVYGGKSSISILNSGVITIPSLYKMSLYDSGNPSSIEFWIKVSSSSSTEKVIMYKGDISDPEVKISLINDYLVYTIGTSSNKKSVSVNIDSINKPLHIVASYSKSEISLTVNGVSKSKSLYNHSSYFNVIYINNDFKFQKPSGIDILQIDSIALYSYVMTRQQALRHFIYGCGYNIPTEFVDKNNGVYYNFSMDNHQDIKKYEFGGSNAWSITQSNNCVVYNNVLTIKPKQEPLSLFRDGYGSQSDIDARFSSSSEYRFDAKSYLSIEDIGSIFPVTDSGWLFKFTKNGTPSIDETLFILTSPDTDNSIEFVNTSSGIKAFINSDTTSTLVTSSTDTSFYVGFYVVDSSNINLIYVPNTGSPVITSLALDIPLSLSKTDLRIGSADYWTEGENDEAEKNLVTIVSTQYLTKIIGIHKDNSLLYSTKANIEGSSFKHYYTATPNYLEKRFKIQSYATARIDVPLQSLAEPNVTYPGASRLEFGHPESSESLLVSVSGTTSWTADLVGDSTNDNITTTSQFKEPEVILERTITDKDWLNKTSINRIQDGSNYSDLLQFDLTFKTSDLIDQPPYLNYFRLFSYPVIDENNFSMGEPTINLIQNPSFEEDTTGWFVNNSSPVRSSAESVFGNSSLKCVSTGNIYLGPIAVNYNYTRIPVTSNKTYTWSMYLKDYNINSQFNSIIEWYDINNDYISNVSSSNFSISTSFWTRAIFTTTAPSNAKFCVPLIVTTGTPTTGTYFFADGAQLEQKSYATPYVDGNLPNGYWSGLENRSTSSRINNKYLTCNASPGGNPAKIYYSGNEVSVPDLQEYPFFYNGNKSGIKIKNSYVKITQDYAFPSKVAHIISATKTGSTLYYTLNDNTFSDGDKVVVSEVYSSTDWNFSTPATISMNPSVQNKSWTYITNYTYSSTSTYALNDIVYLYDGKFYKNTYTGAPRTYPNPPFQEPQYWTVLSYNSASAWSSTKNYATDNVVSYSGSYYIYDSSFKNTIAIQTSDSSTFDSYPVNEEYQGNMSIASGIQTVSFMAYIPSTTTSANLIKVGSSQLSLSSITLSLTGATIYVNGIASSTIKTNSWNHITFIFNTPIYVTDSTPKDIILGNISGTSEFYADQLMIFDKKFTAKTVTNLYNLFSGDFQNTVYSTGPRLIDDNGEKTLNDSTQLSKIITDTSSLAGGSAIYNLLKGQSSPKTLTLNYLDTEIGKDISTTLEKTFTTGSQYMYVTSSNNLKSGTPGSYLQVNGFETDYYITDIKNADVSIAATAGRVASSKNTAILTFANNTLFALLDVGDKVYIDTKGIIASDTKITKIDSANNKITISCAKGKVINDSFTDVVKFKKVMHKLTFNTTVDLSTIPTYDDPVITKLDLGSQVVFDNYTQNNNELLNNKLKVDRQYIENEDYIVLKPATGTPELWRVDNITTANPTGLVDTDIYTTTKTVTVQFTKQSFTSGTVYMDNQDLNVAVNNTTAFKWNGSALINFAKNLQDRVIAYTVKK